MVYSVAAAFVLVVRWVWDRTARLRARERRA
jgi:hypothetical protein